MCKKTYEITATVCDKRGRVLAKEKNSYSKSHPLQAKYAAKVGLDNKIYLHAEIAAIIKANKTGIPYSIFVERYDKFGNPACAKPCPICNLFIAENGIKIVEYTE